MIAFKQLLLGLALAACLASTVLAMPVESHGGEATESDMDNQSVVAVGGITPTDGTSNVTEDDPYDSPYDYPPMAHLIAAPQESDTGDAESVDNAELNFSTMGEKDPEKPETEGGGSNDDDPLQDMDDTTKSRENKLYMSELMDE